MRISFVCDMTWDALEGDDTIERHCSACDKSVFNLSGMTQIEAAEFLAARVDRPPCVRFRLEDGRIAHAEAEQQLRSQGIGAAKLLAAAAVLNAGVAVALDNPYGFVLGPYAMLVESCALYDNNREVAGGLTTDPRRLLDIRMSADCTREACPDIARAAYGRGIEHERSEAPTAVYDAYLEFRRASEALALWGLSAEEHGIGDVRRRMEGHEQTLDLALRDLKISHHTLQQRRSSEKPAEWDAFKAKFSDDDNPWMSWVLQTERQHRDDGTW